MNNICIPMLCLPYSATETVYIDTLHYRVKLVHEPQLLHGQNIVIYCIVLAMNNNNIEVYTYIYCSVAIVSTDVHTRASGATSFCSGI